MPPTISIITVVYNCQTTIAATLHSVLEQSYPHIQYIVIDGNSSDGTQEVIELQSSRIYYYHSQADKGLYDAMNQGMAVATGDFVLFLNAGDLFYEQTTVQQMVAGITELDALYFGTAVLTDRKNIFRLRPPSPDNITQWLAEGGLPNHQATLFPRSFYAQHQYDLNFRISADDDYKIRALRQLPARHLNLWAVTFELEGLSRSYKSWKLIRRRMREQQNLRAKHFPGQPRLGPTEIKYAIKSVVLWAAQSVTGYHWKYDAYFNKFDRIPAGQENHYRGFPTS